MALNGSRTSRPSARARIASDQGHVNAGRDSRSRAQYVAQHRFRQLRTLALVQSLGKALLRRRQAFERDEKDSVHGHAFAPCGVAQAFRTNSASSLLSAAERMMVLVRTTRSGVGRGS